MSQRSLGFFRTKKQIYLSEYLLYIYLMASYITHGKKRATLRTFPFGKRNKRVRRKKARGKRKVFNYLRVFISRNFFRYQLGG